MWFEERREGGGRRRIETRTASTIILTYVLLAATPDKLLHVPFQGGDAANAKDEDVEARRLRVLGPSLQISARRSLSTQARKVEDASSTSAWEGSRRVVAILAVSTHCCCCCCCLGIGSV